jgi:hypothetical protein
MSIRIAAHSVAGLATVAIIGFALAQAPMPVEEQVRIFNSMSPAQQQALIRELQRTLPPGQREAIIRVLQGEGNVEETADDGEALEAEPVEPPKVEPVPAARAPEGPTASSR